jgi:hypothetical protein
MKFPFVKALILTGLLVVVGCDLTDSSDESADQANELMPISEGNTWEAEGVGMDTPEALTLSAIGDTRTINRRVFDEVVLAGFDEEADGDGGGSYVHQGKEGLYFSAEKGWFYFGSAEGDVEEIDMFFRYPVEGGVQYFHTNKYRSFQIKVQESEIEVPAGSFETIAYELQEGGWDNSIVFHFKPGLGPVAVVGLDESGNEVGRFQLVEYEVD